MKKHLVLVALGLSLAACAQAADNEGATTADQITANAPGPSIEPGPVQAVSPDGVRAAAVLFVHEQIVLNDTTGSESPAKEWFSTTTASDAWFEKRDEEKSTFYFTGKAKSGTVRHLVIEKDFPFTAFVPSYNARIDESAGAVPATAKHLEGVDLSALLALAAIGRVAMQTPAEPAAVEFSKFTHEWLGLTHADVQFLAPGDAQYKFSAVILGAAETTAGDASLSLRVTGDTYAATATINKTNDGTSAKP